MVEAPRHTSVRGPTFIRLLARLTDGDVPQSPHSLPDRLGQWIDWNHAVALSRALDGRSSASVDGPAFGSAEEDECARVRASLASAIAERREPAASRQPATAPAGPGGEHAQPDYAPFRQHCLDMQRAMLTATGHLRGRLRDMLAGKSAEMARLADVDAVMERALSPREQTLLAAVPALLGEHFERLRQAAQQAPSEAPAAAATPATPAPWLDAFRKDMRHVLLAELDVRFQPIDGLLAALRTS